MGYDFSKIDALDLLIKLLCLLSVAWNGIVLLSGPGHRTFSEGGRAVRPVRPFHAASRPTAIKERR